jgi:hypothetical protein
VAIETKMRPQNETSGAADFTDFAMEGRGYTWSGNEPLPVLLSRKEDIMARNAEAQERAKSRAANRPIWDVVSEALDDEDDSLQCNVCAI